MNFIDVISCWINYDTEHNLKIYTKMNKGYEYSFTRYALIN